MTATATWTQFLEIVKAENNPQILYTIDKDGRPLRLHIRAWGSIVLNLQDAPTEAEFQEIFCYAKRIEILDA